MVKVNVRNLLMLMAVLLVVVFTLMRRTQFNTQMFDCWASSVVYKKNKSYSDDVTVQSITQPTTQMLSSTPSSKTPHTLDWKTVNVHTLQPHQIIDYFHWTNSTSCKLAHDFGGKIIRHPSGFDGQKSICLDPNVRPSEDHCIVYSIGINNDWSFDETMEKYGCRIFSFDPSMGKPTHDHSQKIHFFNFGLASRDYVDGRNWTMKTLSSMYKILSTAYHGEAVIDYLKIDVEFAEWDVLPQIISSGMLTKVRQLGVEFHILENKGLPYYRSLVGIIKSIEDAGMVRFSNKYNPWYLGQIKALDNYTGPLGFEIAFYQTI